MPVHKSSVNSSSYVYNLSLSAKQLEADPDRLLQNRSDQVSSEIIVTLVSLFISIL